MSERTPGPWAIFRATQGPNILVVSVEDAKGRRIAHLWRDGAEREANACLIAAAPELLEALEWALSYAETLATDEDGLDKACAAIAKARGEQP